MLVRDSNIFAADVVLVRTGHVLVKDLEGDGNEGGVSNPCPVMPGGDFTELVGANFGHGAFVGGGIVLDRNLGRHASHSGYLSSIYRVVSRRLGGWDWEIEVKCVLTYDKFG